MEKFCEARYHQEGADKNLKLGFHLLKDHKNQVAYCFAPKVGCTHLKLAFFRAEGSKTIYHTIAS